MVIKRLVYLVFWMQLSGESKEKKNQVRLNTKQNFKKFQILSFQDGVQCTEVKFFLMAKFEDVWNLTLLCRLFYFSSFGASFPVSTKEFWWDLSFNAKLRF